MIIMKMATAHSQIRVRTELTCFIFIFSTILLAAVAATDDDDEAVYMSQLLKELRNTPPSWSNETHFCKWSGIVCNNSNGHVTSIKLPSSSLTGKLPPELYNLTDLTHIDLHNNSLSGTVPLLPGDLETVLLDHNKFTTIPEDFFSRVSNLKTLNLSNNLNLSPWIIPTELRWCPLLQTLDLQATNLIGSLPDVFDRIPKLETIDLSHNNLSGTLPESLGKSSIKILKLNNQQGINERFSGRIEVISSMRLLSQAWLNDNQLYGLIPDLSNCTKLFDLQLHSNYLYGMVPHSLMALSSLKTISLDNNRLQGPIPVFPNGVKATCQNNYFCRSNIGPCDPQVTILLIIAEALEFSGFLYNMVWTGNNPCENNWEYVGCNRRGKVISVNLDNQGLTGTISPLFANLTGLVNLTLSNNNLNGSIPYSLTTLPQLQLLDLSNNNLTGQIPNFSSKVKVNTTGNDVFLRRKTSGDAPRGDPSKRANTTSPNPIWIAGAAVLSVVIAIVIVIIYRRRRYLGLVQKRIFNKTRTHLFDNVEDFIKTYNLSMPRRYSYVEVKRITNSFRDKLGQGGYGVVYKGCLPDGRQVAVKLINDSKGDGEEFINEVGSISRTLHVNIVSLLGFCYEKKKRALIYEFMSNGSLDRFIYRKGVASAICELDWNTLYQIVVGIARGLEYLHQGCNSRILHLDIKPQNILLDEDFCPKISDFGLAKICQKNDSIVSILGARGTIGFIAPEVFSRAYGGVSHKSDVYSYGMLIVEMIGGKKNHYTGGSCTTEMYFPDWIYKDLELSDKLENRLGISEEENDMVRKITMVSLWCIQTNPLDRPSMSKVIEMLQDPLQDVPYPSKPTLYTPKRASSLNSYMSSTNLLDTNSIASQENVPLDQTSSTKTSENVIVM